MQSMPGKRLDDLLVSTRNRAVRIQIVDPNQPPAVPGLDAEVARECHIERPQVQVAGGRRSESPDGVHIVVFGHL